MALTFTTATVADADALAALINSAYRGETSRQGWTTEADLLDGLRTDGPMLVELITAPDSLLVTCRQGKQLAGSVHLRKAGSQAQIGMLAVRPDWQDQGIGKRLLDAAENIALDTWQIRRWVMFVIPSRIELLAYYQRRGYRRTGIIQAFPQNPALWTPKVTGLSLEMLEKWVPLDGWE